MASRANRPPRDCLATAAASAGGAGAARAVLVYIPVCTLSGMCTLSRERHESWGPQVALETWYQAQFAVAAQLCPHDSRAAAAPAVHVQTVQ